MTSRSKKPIRVIGIDPGSRYTGYGLIRARGHDCAYLGSGRINAASAETLPDRLAIIYEGLREVIDTYTPDTAAVESLFVARNAMSSLKLGHARGICLLALKHDDMPFFEYAPNRVKNTVAGYGRADKKAVKKMVKTRLEIEGKLSNDASDALAIAICHCYSPATKPETTSS